MTRILVLGVGLVLMLNTVAMAEEGTIIEVDWQVLQDHELQDGQLKLRIGESSLTLPGTVLVARAIERNCNNGIGEYPDRTLEQDFGLTPCDEPVSINEFTQGLEAFREHKDGAPLGVIIVAQRSNERALLFYWAGPVEGKPKLELIYVLQRR